MPSSRPFSRSFPGAILLLCACHGQQTNVPGDSGDHRPYEGIGAGQIVHFGGTEPFWGGQIEGGTLILKTPEQPEGSRIAVKTFGGRGGASYSGETGGRDLTLALTPGTCSDGMSDRGYPFSATLRLGEQIRQGCAWTDAAPGAGPPAP